MKAMELFQAVMKAETPEERFKLIEDNVDTINSFDGGGNAEMEENFNKLTEDFQKLTENHQALNQKYQDRFFAPADKKEEKKEEVEQPKTIDDVVKEMA